jgi:hypothetical protein
MTVVIAEPVLFHFNNLFLANGKKIGFGLSLTAIQLQTVSYVLGDDTPSHDQYIKPVDGDAAWMCGNQIVQRDDFPSFSTLGIVLVFLLGGFLLVLVLFLDQLIAFWYTKVHPSKAWKLKIWRANRTLQVQSQAFEENVFETWDSKERSRHRAWSAVVNPFCTVLPEEDSKPQKEAETSHWWQLGGRRDVIDASFSHGTPTIPAEASSPGEKSSFRAFEIELGSLSNHLRPMYQRKDTE